MKSAKENFLGPIAIVAIVALIVVVFLAKPGFTPTATGSAVEMPTSAKSGTVVVYCDPATGIMKDSGGKPVYWYNQETEMPEPVQCGLESPKPMGTGDAGSPMGTGTGDSGNPMGDGPNRAGSGDNF